MRNTNRYFYCKINKYLSKTRMLLTSLRRPTHDDIKHNIQATSSFASRLKVSKSIGISFTSIYQSICIKRYSISYCSIGSSQSSHKTAAIAAEAAEASVYVICQIELSFFFVKSMMMGGIIFAYNVDSVL